MSRSELKESAKASLKGKYGDIIIMFIAVAIVSAVASCAGAWFDNLFGLAKVEVIDLGFMKYTYRTTGILTALFSFIVTGCLGFGIIEYFLNISRGKEVNWKDIFKRYDLFVPFVLLSIITGLIICVGTILLIIPGIIAALTLSMVLDQIRHS